MLQVDSTEIPKLEIKSKKLSVKKLKYLKKPNRVRLVKRLK